LKKEKFTLKGCLHNVITPDTNIQVKYDEAEATYCSSFWRDDGVCIQKVCITWL